VAIVVGELGKRAAGVSAMLEQFGGAQKGKCAVTEIAATIEAGAAAIEHDANADWDRFWRDVPKLLGNDLSALLGRRVLLGTDGALHASGADMSIFFPPGRGEDDDEDDLQTSPDMEEVPPILRDHFAFLSDKVPTHASDEQGRRRRTALYGWLNSIRLVTTFRAENVVRRVILPAIPSLPVLLAGEKDVGLRQLLRWALALYGRRRLEVVAQALAELPFPCVGGWFRAKDCAFGPGWASTQGENLRTYLGSVKSPAGRLAAARMLLPPSDARWQGTESTKETLMELGVFDGLRLAQIEPDEWYSYLDVVWIGQEKYLSVPEQPPKSYPTELWARYSGAYSKKCRPTYQSGYRFKAVYTFCGLEEFPALSPEARSAMMQLLIGSIPRWDRTWATVSIHRPSGYADNLSLRSPLAHALASLDWINVDNEGEQIQARPIDHWFIPSTIHTGQSHQFRHLVPLPLALTRQIEAIPGAVEALTSLGMPVYDPDRSTSDSRLLNDLATAWLERNQLVRNRDVFVGQVRAAWNKLNVTAATTSPKRLIVYEADGQIGVIAPDLAAPIYVPDGEDVVNNALRAMRVSTLLIDAREAKSLWPHLSAWYGHAIARASDMAVRPFTGAQSVESYVNAATLLSDDSRLEWLPLVVLTIAAFQSDRSHGTGTKAFRDGLRQLRTLRINRVPQLDLCIERNGVIHYQQPVAAFWLRTKNAILLNIGHEDVLLADISGAMRTVLDRGDRELEYALRLVLSRLAHSEHPTQDEILHALRQVGIGERQYGEVAQHWTGEQAWNVERLKPIVYLFLGRDGLSVFEENTADVNRHIMLDQLLVEMGINEIAPHTLVDLVRSGKTNRQIGEHLHSLVDATAELVRWNDALTELGHTPVVNDEVFDHFQAHCRSASKAIRSVLRDIIKRDPQGRNFRTLNGGFDELKCPVSLTRKFWDLPFNAAMQSVAAFLQECGAVAPEIDAVTEAESVEDLLSRVQRIGVDPFSDPLQVHADNDREFNSVVLELKSVAIICSDRNQQPMPTWVEDSLVGSGLLEKHGFLDRLGQDQWFLLLKVHLDAQQDTEFLRGLRSAVSLEGLLQLLSITSADLKAADSKLMQARERASRVRRMLNVCGKAFENEPSNLRNLAQHLIECIPEMVTDSFDLQSAAGLERIKSRPTTGKNAGGKVGVGTRKRDKDKEELVGIVGEMHAFRMLQRKYGSDVVTPSNWRSEISHHWFPGNGGNDSAGFDFDLQLGEINYLIEVKSSAGFDEAFELGSSEIGKATEVASRRRTKFVILRVFNALDVKPTFSLLPNPYEPASKGLYLIQEGGLRVRYREKR
jgi:hypothetical protein